MERALVIIYGFPSSGKSTVARRLAREIGLPLLSKDVIKEALFSNHCDMSIEQARDLGRQSIEVAYRLLEEQLLLGLGCIVESVFRREWDRERFQNLIRRHKIWSIEIQCGAPSDVLVERYRRRQIEGERHAFHFDCEREAEWRKEFEKEFPMALEVADQVLRVDTSHSIDLTMKGLLALIRKSEPVGGGQRSPLAR